MDATVPEPIIDIIEEAVRTGAPFRIGSLRYGSETMRLAHPIEVVAYREPDGVMIANDDLGLYGFGNDAGSAYEDLSGCVMSAYELFGQRDDPQARGIRRLVEG